MPRKQNKQVKKKPRQKQKQRQTVNVNVKIDQSKRGGGRRGGGVSRPPIYSSSITMNAPTVPLPIYQNIPLSTPLQSNQQKTGLSIKDEPKPIPRTETPIKQEPKPIPRKETPIKKEPKPIPRKETPIKKEPLEKNDQKTNLKPSPFPKMSGVAGREMMDNIRKEEEEQKRQKEKQAYKEKFGDSPSPRKSKIEDSAERRRQRTQLQKELISNKRFIERRNTLADQVDRNMRDAGQIPLPDEDAELSDMSYDNENYTYYGNKERLS